MRERTWLRSSEPMYMVYWLTTLPAEATEARTEATEARTSWLAWFSLRRQPIVIPAKTRKVGLFNCACGRLNWKSLENCHRKYLEDWENVIEGNFPPDQFHPQPRMIFDEIGFSERWYYAAYSDPGPVFSTEAPYADWWL